MKILKRLTALAPAWRHVVRSGVALCGAALLASTVAHAQVVNGKFETGNFTGWNVDYLRNNAIPTFPPLKKADLGLVASTAATNLNNTVVAGAGTDGLLTIPLEGSYSANVNHRGDNNRASSIHQTYTTTLADVDATDNKIHLRMAVAPVIEDGGHDPDEQAYFFVEVTNLTKGTQMFQTFNFANQPGVPWQTIGGYQYTGWQAIDVAPGNGFLDVGDQVRIEIIAAGCSQGGHSGEVYVDTVGAFFKGVQVTATAATTALPGTDITYTYTYSNTSGLTVTDTTVNATTPQTLNAASTVLNATFVSLNAPAGTCTAPAVGASGQVSCNFGTLNDQTSGTFQVTYHIPATATTNAPNNKLNHGDYAISAVGASTFLGPLVQTNLIGSGTLTDLSVTVSDGVSAVAPNGALTYTVVVTNNGPTAVTGASLSQPVASALTVGAWTCAGAAGASCGNTSGSGGLGAELLNIPVGGSVTFTLQATAGASGTTSTTFVVAPPAGTIDSNTANNAAGDTNQIGALHNVVVTKAGAGTGTVVSAPAGMNCGASCGMQVVDGGQVILTASAPAGSIFTGWSGACTGTANPCTVSNITADVAVVARFEPVATVSAVVGPNGSATPAEPQVVAVGSTVVYTLTPGAGYVPVVSGNCPGVLAGNTYTVGPVAGNCTAQFDFSNIVVTSSTGANGTVSPLGGSGVVSGGQLVYNLTPAPGFVPRVATGGSACGGTLSGNTFTTSPVAANCTVDVTFEFVAQANAVPTLSQWGLLMLSALMGLMVLGARRKHMV